MPSITSCTTRNGNQLSRSLRCLLSSPFSLFSPVHHHSPPPRAHLAGHMAANYWESTQRKFWQFTKDELAAIRQRLDEEDSAGVHMFPLPQLRHLNIYFNQRKS
jgi:hypothetical protein